jgi:phenylacetate-CoA ligase
VILRVVRSDGSDAPPGEGGRVVVTDLMNYVMPFINYAIGDCAVMGPPCPCGRGFPTLSSVEGRDTEAIQTPAGRRISGVVLGHFLAFVARVIPYVLEYQAIQTAPGRVTLRIVPGKEFTPEFAGALQSQVESFLGRDMAVSLELVDRIPLEPSGKRLIVKTRLSGATAP